MNIWERFACCLLLGIMRLPLSKRCPLYFLKITLSESSSNVVRTSPHPKHFKGQVKYFRLERVREGDDPPSAPLKGRSDVPPSPACEAREAHPEKWLDAYTASHHGGALGCTASSNTSAPLRLSEHLRPKLDVKEARAWRTGARWPPRPSAAQTGFIGGAPPPFAGRNCSSPRFVCILPPCLYAPSH